MNDSNWKYVVKTLTEMQHRNTQMLHITDVLEIQLDSPLANPFFMIFDSLIDSLAVICGDDSDYCVLNWWIFDCHFGESPSISDVAPELGVIRTTDDLRILIEKVGENL